MSDFQVPFFPDFRTPAATTTDKLSNLNLITLPTRPEIKYVARLAIAAINTLETFRENQCNDQMMTSIWVFSGDTEYGQGNAGHYEVIYATGTQEVLHVSLSYITVPRINPPSFVSVEHSTHHVDVNPAEYVQIYLRDGFTPPVSRIPEYPHRLDKLRHLIPNPDQRSGAFVDHTQDAKEVYRQDVLAKLEELEQAIQVAKEQWRQW